MSRESRAPAQSRQVAVDDLNRELLTLARRIRSKPPVAGDHPYLEASLDALCGVLAARGAMRFTDLAEALWLDKSTVTRQVTTLEHLGFVERTPDPSDGRAALVGLTDDGRDILNRSRQARREGTSELLADWDIDDVTTFAALLERLNREVEQSQRPKLVALPGRRGRGR